MGGLKTQLILVIIIAFIIGLFAGARLPKRIGQLTASLTGTPDIEEEEEIKTEETVLVISVLDGDTIEIEGEEHVRYIGIDAPETSTEESEVCYAKEATEANRSLVEGKEIRIERDISERDALGRLLRYVYVKDPETDEEIFVNLNLIQEGIAFAVSYPPDVFYEQEFLEAEQIVKEEGRGVWSVCE